MVNVDAHYDLRYVDTLQASQPDLCPDSTGSGEYHVILLNYLWPSWWRNAIADAKTVILADGAASRLAAVAAGETLNECGRHEGSSAELRVAADTVCRLLSSALGAAKFISVGDYDSMTPRTVEFLETYGIARNHVPEQDSTDGSKALTLLLNLLSVNKSSGPSSAPATPVTPVIPRVLMLGAFGGRLDHCLCHFCLLHKYGSQCTIHLHGDNNVALLIPPTQVSSQREPSPVTLSLPRSLKIDAVGVIAHNGPCRVWSEGLKWDMNGLLLGYETIQSGCNVPLSKSVRVSSDGFVIFTLSYSLTG